MTEVLENIGFAIWLLVPLVIGLVARSRSTAAVFGAVFAVFFSVILVISDLLFGRGMVRHLGDSPFEASVRSLADIAALAAADAAYAAIVFTLKAKIKARRNRAMH